MKSRIENMGALLVSNFSKAFVELFFMLLAEKADMLHGNLKN